MNCNDSGTRNMKIGLDLDGTIYNMLDAIFELDQIVREKLGYEPISKTEYRRLFQTENWRKLCLDLGIREADTKEYRKKIEEMVGDMTPPALIPGGRKAVKKIEDRWGVENLYFVTNGGPDGIRRRFERDGLLYLFDRVSHPCEGKTDALFDIASENPEMEFIYVGDLVSDGSACRQARSRGAENIRFCAVTHEYAMNLPEMLIDFAHSHDFASNIESIGEIQKVWE